MLTTDDLMARFKCSRRTIANWYARRIIPEPLKIGGLLRWREEDIETWEDYLAERRDYRNIGGDPDSPDGPAPPVYSTGIETKDPRDIAARLRERERQEKSRTLAASSEPIEAETLPMLPEPSAEKTAAKREED